MGHLRRGIARKGMRQATSMMRQGWRNRRNIVEQLELLEGRPGCAEKEALRLHEEGYEMRMYYEATPSDPMPEWMK